MFARLSMVLDHRFAVRHASAYVDGELDARAERRMRDHAAVCPMCAELVLTLRRTVASLRDLRARPEQGSEATGSVVPFVLDALRAEVARDHEGRPPDDG